MPDSILFVCVTRGVFADEVLGGLDRMATRGTFLESPEKPFLKLRLAYSVKQVFSYVVKGIKIKTTSKFRASRRLCFKDTKRIMSPEMSPKSFGTFEKRTRGPFYQMLCEVCEGCHKRDHYRRCLVSLISKLPWYRLRLSTCHWIWCRSRWSMFSTAWETLMTLEFSTISFLERLSDDSNRNFLNALTSSNASWASNYSLNRWV